VNRGITDYGRPEEVHIADIKYLCQSKTGISHSSQKNNQDNRVDRKSPALRHGKTPYRNNSQLSIYNIQLKEWVRKPSSVFRVTPGGGHFSGPSVARRLSQKGCDLPAGFMTGPARGAPKGPPACLVLQAVGFALPSASPPARCALAAPFHPCLIPVTGAIGGVFSVALSRGSLRVAVNHHRALPCSDFPPAVSDRRPPDPLAPIISYSLPYCHNLSEISSVWIQWDGS
jgi:hypothetical protein